MSRFHSLRRQAGIGTPTAIFLVGGLAAVGLGVASLTGVAESNGGKSVDTAAARSLAESGVQTLYAKIRKEVREGSEAPGVLPDTMLSDPADEQRTLGLYSSRVLSADVTTSEVNMGDGSVATRTTTVYTIEGRGRVRNAQGRVRARFVATIDRSNGRYRDDTIVNPEGEGNGVPFSVCPGAISSNGRVLLRTDGGFRTVSTDKTGDIVANKGIVWAPYSGAKTGIRTTNLIELQGQFQVPGSAEYAHIYDQTVGPDGLGNSNGSKNYRSPRFNETPDNPALEADTVARRLHPRPYPNTDMFSGWDAEWREKTSAANNFPGSIDTANYGHTDPSGATVLTTPAYINGDLIVRAGATLKLAPHSDQPWKNVIYVNGNVKNLASLRNLGVTLVIRGKYSDGAASEYSVDPSGPRYTDEGTVMAKANMVSLNPAADAVTFTTDRPQKTGLVYATHGGIRVLGQSPDITGKLNAAGSNDAAGIFIEPRNGTAATLRYDPRCGGNRHIVPSAETTTSTVRRTLVEPGTVVRPFDPGRLEGWTLLK